MRGNNPLIHQANIKNKAIQTLSSTRSSIYGLKEGNHDLKMAHKGEECYASYLISQSKV